MSGQYGIDLGSRRLAAVCADTMHVAEIRLPKVVAPAVEDISATLHKLGDWIAETIPADARLWVEMPVVGQRGGIGTAIRMAMTAGCVIDAHPGPSLTVSNSRWKAQVVGNGRADKNAVTAWLRRHHPALAEACRSSQDLRDAACISLGAATLASAG